MKLVILDRDGVINEDSDAFIKSPAEWLPIPGSLEAIARLNHRGLRVLVVTNQSGLARGLFNMDDLNAIHQQFHQRLDAVGGQVEGIFFCPHGPQEGCSCRKPKTGLLMQIQQRFGVDFQATPMVGDSLRDIEAYRAVGGLPILVSTGKGRVTWERHRHRLGDIRVMTDLADAADWIIDQLDQG